MRYKEILPCYMFEITSSFILLRAIADKFEIVGIRVLLTEKFEKQYRREVRAQEPMESIALLKPFPSITEQPIPSDSFSIRRSEPVEAMDGGPITYGEPINSARSLLRRSVVW
ncbi:hypothetical protein J6590_055640 [Homalodisca vitripennis]|nr:hypothetical protein J6590_055640 [Homalodisca vitripennis]